MKEYNAAMENTTRPTIMVVDDYDDVQVILKRWLTQHLLTHAVV